VGICRWSWTVKGNEAARWVRKIADFEWQQTREHLVDGDSVPQCQGFRRGVGREEVIARREGHNMVSSEG